MQRRPKRRMPGKRQLFRNSEDADFVSFAGGIARQGESCLGKIHLTRERLHFPIIQAACIGKNGERITRQRPLCENVKLNEFVSAVRHKNLSILCRRQRKTNINLWRQSLRNSSPSDRSLPAAAGYPISFLSQQLTASTSQLSSDFYSESLQFDRGEVNLNDSTAEHLNLFSPVV